MLKLEIGGWFVNAVMTYVALLSPEISLIGADDVPHIYFAREAVKELGALSLCESIADVLYGDWVEER